MKHAQLSRAGIHTPHASIIPITDVARLLEPLGEHGYSLANGRIIFGMHRLTLKHAFARTLQRANDIASDRGHKNLFDISPRAFVFPDDFDTWLQIAEAEPEKIWISKPGAGDRGEGIVMVTDIHKVEPTQDLVLQEYISNPHLLGGYKYTLRFFVLVTSLDPLRVYIYPDGLTKLTTQPFTTDRASLGNLFIHLTNPGVLRGDTSADFSAQRFTHAEYRERIRKDGIDDTRLFKEIHAIIAKSLLSVREVVLHQYAQHDMDPSGHYMLFGYDILIDENLRPWVIEVNAGPSLDTEAGDTAAGIRERELKLNVATETLQLAGVIPQSETRFEPLFPSPEIFDLLPHYEIVRPHDWEDLKNASIAQARKATRSSTLSDIASLHTALKTTPEHSLYAFYLAESLRDAGNIKAALGVYQDIAARNDNAEITYAALLEIAKIHAASADDPTVVITAFRAAHEYRPTRAEAMCYFATYLREQGHAASAYSFAKTAKDTPRPPDSFYVDESVYAWRALDEFAIAAYWSDHFKEGTTACRSLLKSKFLPETERERITQNLKFCTSKLNKKIKK